MIRMTEVLSKLRTWPQTEQLSFEMAHGLTHAIHHRQVYFHGSPRRRLAGMFQMSDLLLHSIIMVQCTSARPTYCVVPWRTTPGAEWTKFDRQRSAANFRAYSDLLHMEPVPTKAFDLAATEGPTATFFNAYHRDLYFGFALYRGGIVPHEGCMHLTFGLEQFNAQLSKEEEV